MHQLIIRHSLFEQQYQLEVASSREEMSNLLNEIRGLCTTDGWIGVHQDRLFDLIEELRDALAMHFAIEESSVLSRQAMLQGHLAHEARILRAEHMDLYEQSVDLAEEAVSLRNSDATPQVLNEFCKQFYMFDSRLIAHESRERSLRQACG